MSKINTPAYPDFQYFTVDDFSWYQDFISQFPQHCDFTLNNLLVWIGGKDQIFKYSWLNGNMIIHAEESLYNGGDWFTILGNKMADDTLETLSRAKNIKGLEMVPDYFVEGIADKDRYATSDDSDNYDYILNIEKLLEKNGKLYANFRYQISYFLKNYSEEAHLKELDLSNIECTKEITSALQTWPKINSFIPGGNDPKKLDEKAILRLLSIQEIIPNKHRCLGLYINRTLQGFSIYHIPEASEKIAIGNHIKFNGEYRRLFDFLVYATASRLHSEGITILNAEQDMGIEGIRNHKKDLNPMTYYKKYSIAF